MCEWNNITWAKGKPNSACIMDTACPDKSLSYFNYVSRGYLKEPHSFYRQTLYAYSTQPISLPSFRTTNNYQHAAVMGTTTRKVRISDLYQKNVVRF